MVELDPGGDGSQEGAWYTAERVEETVVEDIGSRLRTEVQVISGWRHQKGREKKEAAYQ